MKKLILALLLAAALPGLAAAGWWVENDYITGSNGLNKDSLSTFTMLKHGIMLGAGAAYYKDKAANKDEMYSFRLPIMHTGRSNILSFSPFIYPVSAETGSGAYGAKAYVQTTLTEPDDENYLRLLFSAAAASQKARITGGDRKDFSESALEMQVEKSYYSQFFLLASAAAFTKPSGVSNTTLVQPALDHSDMAYFGALLPVTALPEWVITAQASRSMKPDFDSYVYLGYSKISFRQTGDAGSLIAGLKFELSTDTTLDLAYNAFKLQNTASKNYGRVLLRTVF